MGTFVVAVHPVTDPALQMNVETCTAKWRQDYLGTLERCLTEPDPSDPTSEARGYSYQDRGFTQVRAL